MAIAVATTRQELANKYAALGNWIGVTKGAPGAGPAVANEATGGTPAYARKQTAWTAGTGGVINGTGVTIDLPAGTYTHGIICSAATGANMIDFADFVDVVLATQGQIICTPQFVQA